MRYVQTNGTVQAQNIIVNMTVDDSGNWDNAHLFVDVNEGVFTVDNAKGVAGGDWIDYGIGNFTMTNSDIKKE